MMNNFDKRLSKLEERKAAKAVDNSGWVVPLAPEDEHREIVSVGRHWYFKDEGKHETN